MAVLKSLTTQCIMQTAPDIHTVYQAISTLYEGNDEGGSSKASASLWLEKLQKSVFAWTLADQLLAANHSQVACYFAAQTMHSKIRTHFHELPRESHNALKHSYPSDRLRAEPHAVVIVTQLCLALVDLYLQVPEWNALLQELFNRFGTEPSRVAVMLTVLRMFPEEIGCGNEEDSVELIRVSEHRRTQLDHEFANQLPNVLLFVSKICAENESDMELLGRCFACVSAWMKHESCPTDILAESSLMTNILHLLANDQAPAALHDAATECVVSALRRIHDPCKHTALATVLHTAIVQLATPFHTCVAREDMDKLGLHNYARLFTELAESLVPAIVETPGQGLGDLNTMDLLLLVVGHHDYSLAEMTFNVWYRLSEFVYQVDVEWLLDVFRPYIERLVLALHRHCRLETDTPGLPDPRDDFQEFRAGVAEALKDVVFIAGTERVVNMMFSILQSQAAASTWDETEAALYVLLAVAKNILPDERQVMPQVVGAVLQLTPDMHACVRLTAIRLLGQLNEWLDNNDALIERSVDWLLCRVQSTEQGVCEAAAESVEFVCTQSKHKLTAHFANVAQAALHLQQLDTAQTAVQSMLRATMLLSTQSQSEQGTSVQLLCEPAIQRLAQILTHQAQSTAHGNKENEPGSAQLSPVPVLDQLTAVLRHLEPCGGDNGQSRPWLPVIEKCLPLLLDTLVRYDKHISTTEHCCRTVRFAIRSLGVQSCAFVEPLVTTLIEIYGRHQHSCYLYLGSILVDEYGSFPQLVPGLVHMLEMFCVPTFTMFEQAMGMRNHPDTIDDFFRMCVRLLQRSPAALFSCSQASAIWVCGMAALTVDHPEAIKSVCKFFCELLGCIAQARRNSVSDPAVAAAEQQLASNACPLTTACLNASVFCLSRPAIRDVAEILLALTTLDSKMMSTWLQQAIENMPKPAQAPNPQQWHQFHQTIVSATELRIVTCALRELVRLFR